jgi:hypothetical protein
MGGNFKLMVALAALILIVSGCGDSTSRPGGSASQEKPYPWIKGPAREFLGPDGASITATFGREASKAEREQASRVIAAWMRARAARDWVKDCSHFSRRYVKSLVAEDAVKVSHGKVENCPQALAYFGSQASGDYKNTLSGPIDSLRIRGRQGYALYHGRDGRDWSVPMDREGGKWLVSIAAPVEEG